MKKVLIVEDNDKMAIQLKEAFEAEGFQVIRASDGKEAARILEGESVDIIASDVNMPGIGGYELAKSVKSNLKTHDLPFVLYSSREATEEDVELAIRAGVDKYIEKTGTKAIVDGVLNQIKKAAR